MNSDKPMRVQYPHTHTDTDNDIVSWYGEEVGHNPLMRVYEAFIPSTGEEIYLLLTFKDWSYHATRDRAVRDVLKAATTALKQQKNYKENYRWWHLWLLAVFLVTKRPVATREIAVKAGNCSAGTNKWFRDHGYADIDIVRWYQLIRHLFFARSRMVIWYLREEYKKQQRSLVGAATA